MRDASSARGESRVAIARLASPAMTTPAAVNNGVHRGSGKPSGEVEGDEAQAAELALDDGAGAFF
jgi:hypothetical protein